MARTMTKKASVNKEVENVINEEKTTVEEVKERVFDKEDYVLCKSITSGVLLVDGKRSGDLYRWADYGDVIEVQYQDLDYMFKAKESWIMKPRFVVEDEDFVSQRPALKELYDSMYSKGDLADILNLPVNQMIKEINNLPAGAKDAIRSLAGSMIEQNRMDSVQRIKAIDSLFNTDFLHLILNHA